MMVYNTRDCWIFGFYPSSRIFKNTIFRDLDLSIEPPVIQIISSFFFNLCGGTLSTAATTGLLYHPRMIGDGDCGEIDGMKIGR
jgi:hypothetical protein